MLKNNGYEEFERILVDDIAERVPETMLTTTIAKNFDSKISMLENDGTNDLFFLS